MAHVIVPEVEEILDKEFKVLDHGFVRLVDYMGGDESVVQAARISYSKGTKTFREDRALIRYLMRHLHTSPFEMVEYKWHCKMPIFVARQWIRHRTANVNEYSLRYSEPEDTFYIPKIGEVRFQGVTNRQGGSEEEVPKEIAEKVIRFITSTSEDSMQKYQEMINDKIARELSRSGLPINLYTQWYWKNDLHNTLHFLKLRKASNAQYEIREYANLMSDIIKKAVPLCYEAFEDFTVNSLLFSSLEINALKRIINGEDKEKVAEEEIESKGERREFFSKLERLIKINPSSQS